MNWPLALLALGMFGFYVWLAVVAYKYDPPPSSGHDHRWVGIRGWLLLLAVVLTVRPFIYGHSLLDLANVMSIDTWSELTTYGNSKYNALWAPLLLFELAAALAQCMFSLLLLPLLFLRRSSFPRLALLVLLTGAALRFGDDFLAGMLPGVKTTSVDTAKTINSVIGAAVWSAYLLRSRRVKSTFVRRYRTSVPAPLQVADGVMVSEPTSQG